MKDTNFPYKRFFIYGASIALYNLLTLLTGLIDNIMLGSYAESALAGASLANQIQFILQMLVMGLGDGLVVVLTRAIGNRQSKVYPTIVKIAIISGSIFAIISFTIMSIAPEPIYRLINGERHIIDNALAYTQIIRFSYPFFIATQLMLSLLRSFGFVRISYSIAIISLLTNSSLNYCLIFGNFNLPEMGIRGAAIATLTARSLELAIVFIYFLTKLKFFNLQYRKFEAKTWQDFYHVSLPLLITQALWGVCNFFYLSILGNYGQTVIVANSISVIYGQVIMVMIYGTANGAQVLMGQALGRGLQTEIVLYHKKFQQLFLVIATISASLVLLSRFTVRLLYPSISTASYNLTLKLLLITAFVCIATGYQVPTDFSLLRAGGDTAFTSYLNIFLIWGITLPLAYLLQLRKVNPALVFLVLRSDQFLKTIAMYLRANRKNWLHYSLNKIKLD